VHRPKDNSTPKTVALFISAMPGRSPIPLRHTFNQQKTTCPIAISYIPFKRLRVSLLLNHGYHNRTWLLAVCNLKIEGGLSPRFAVLTQTVRKKKQIIFCSCQAYLAINKRASSLLTDPWNPVSGATSIFDISNKSRRHIG